jgi:uncharacterized protein YdeI (YjbR/CyaY-like superfamily)
MAGGRWDDPRVFADQATFRRWLAKNHEWTAELWVGFYKKAAGKKAMTYPQGVDEALCWGWIDGVKKRVDEERFTHRFTPRRPASRWSVANLRRYAKLDAEGRVQEPGRAAFARYAATDERYAAGAGRYPANAAGYPAGTERYAASAAGFGARARYPANVAAKRPVAEPPRAAERPLSTALSPDLERDFRAQTKAWSFFHAQPPGYRRMAIGWVMSAKREETRARRLRQIVEASSAGRRLPQISGQARERE